MKLSHGMFQLCQGLKHIIYLTIETLSHKKNPRFTIFTNIVPLSTPQNKGSNRNWFFIKHLGCNL